MRTRNEMVTVAAAMDNEKLLYNFQNAIEKVAYAVNSPDRLCMGHDAYEWEVVVEVAREEILRRMKTR